MKVINKKLVSMLCILVIVLSIGIFLICPKDTEKITLDEVKLKEPEKNSGMFAIMLQSSEGSEEYTQSEGETFPKEGYTLNEEKSGCLDSDGQKISDITLNYADGKVKVETGNTSYCYIYFDIEGPMNLGKACEGQSNFKECVKNNSSKLEKIEDLKSSNIGDLKYRFVGSNPNNYICFGNGAKCTTGDNYMYRIIGITSNGELKLQKYSSLGNKSWHDNYSDDVKWNTSNSSNLFTSLNESGFLNSSTYIPQDDNWKDLILSKTWNIGDIQGTGSGYTDNATEVYNKEKLTPSSNYKIGLMYLSDYYLAYNDGAGTTDCYNTACSSWMFHSEYEWTMSRYGSYGSLYYAWHVVLNGYVNDYALNDTNAVRPVFYLSSEAKIKSAKGSSDDPYIVELQSN